MNGSRGVCRRYGAVLKSILEESCTYLAIYLSEEFSFLHSRRTRAIAASELLGCHEERERHDGKGNRDETDGEREDGGRSNRKWKEIDE